MSSFPNDTTEAASTLLGSDSFCGSGGSDGSNDRTAVAVGGLEELGALPSSPQLLPLPLPTDPNEPRSMPLGGVSIVGNGRADATST